MAIDDGDRSQTLPYANPHVNNFRIPMMFYHPKLTETRLFANWSNLSILPTILDLLQETDSLSGEAKNSAKSLIPGYEEQSLLRQPEYRNSGGGEKYNFGIANPGGTHLAISSPNPKRPWRLTLPLCQPGTWTLANIIEDHDENEVVRVLTPALLFEAVEEKWGDDAVIWAEAALSAAEKWMKETSQRWKTL